MKKAILLLIAGVIMGSAVSFAATALFFDVPSDAWYRGSVARLADRGIINGYADQSFRGGNTVNRAEVAAMIDRAVQFTESTKSATLSLEDASQVAQAASICSKTGNISTKGEYNSSSKTWWFDIAGNNPGCSPACVVRDSDKTSDVNWRCV